VTEIDISGLGGLVVDIDADDVPEFNAPDITIKIGGDVYTAHFPDDAFVVEMLEQGTENLSNTNAVHYMWRLFESSLTPEDYQRLQASFGKTVTLRKFISASQRLLKAWEPHIDSYFAELADTKPRENRAARRAPRKK
jgi:hypothetical protein